MDRRTDLNGNQALMTLLPGEFGRSDSYKGLYRFMLRNQNQEVMYQISDKPLVARMSDLGDKRQDIEITEFWCAENLNTGVFAMMGPREASCESFWRGNLASGVRGVIDPFDPENPYGPGLDNSFSKGGKHSS